jgi:thiamine pyrophosphate-dependent acetolactate synthase large subunit-like protein
MAQLKAGQLVTERYGRMDIRSLDIRHGQGAAFMAHGYVHTAGKPSTSPQRAPPGG